MCRHVRGLRRRQPARRCIRRSHTHGLAPETARQQPLAGALSARKAHSRPCIVRHCPVKHMQVQQDGSGQHLATDGGRSSRLPDGDVDQPVGQDATQERLQTVSALHTAVLQTLRSRVTTATALKTARWVGLHTAMGGGPASAIVLAELTAAPEPIAKAGKLTLSKPEIAAAGRAHLRKVQAGLPPGDTSSCRQRRRDASVVHHGHKRNGPRQVHCRVGGTDPSVTSAGRRQFTALRITSAPNM